MKRYQNPELFERLALAYAAGTLQGKARLRFEHLMEQHLYLRATTHAYQHPFDGLLTLLPGESPPPRVWQQLAQHLELQRPSPRRRWSHWWSHLPQRLPWAVPLLASLATALLTASLLYRSPEPSAYLAALKSTQQDRVVLALADPQQMQISFDLLEQALPPHSGKIPTLWCISKRKQEPPLRMGTLGSPQGITMSPTMWRGLADVSQFAISLEPADAQGQTQPLGEIVLSGELHSIKGR